MKFVTWRKARVKSDGGSARGRALGPKRSSRSATWAVSRPRSGWTAKRWAA
ncbi:hypothetical protein D3C86_2002980 [compost metagenome]